MTAAAVVYAALVLVFAASALRLSRVHITAPIAFVIAGAVIAAVTPSPTADTAGEIRAVAEVTLVGVDPVPRRSAGPAAADRR